MNTATTTPKTRTQTVEISAKIPVDERGAAVRTWAYTTMAASALSGAAARPGAYRAPRALVTKARYTVEVPVPTAGPESAAQDTDIAWG